MRAFAATLESPDHAVYEAGSTRAGDLQDARLPEEIGGSEVGALRAELETKAEKLTDSLGTLETRDAQVPGIEVSRSKSDIRRIGRADLRLWHAAISAATES
jgi:hypothetical protein